VARRSSAFGDLVALLFTPAVWLARALIPQKRAAPDLVKWFYKTPEWKQLRYAHLAKNPACVLCGRSAKDGARMNVDHIKPLSYHWNLRLARRIICKRSAQIATTAKVERQEITAAAKASYQTFLSYSRIVCCASAFVINW